MKKTILIYIAIMLLSALACRKPIGVIEGASEPTSESIESIAQTEAGILPSSSDWPHAEPPERPYFHSVDEYLLLVSAIDLDDVECERFLSDNFFGSGIYTKADAIKTLEIINSMPLPSADGLEFITVELADYKDIFHILYGIEGVENGYLAFDISLTSSDAEAERKELEHKYTLVELPETRNSDLKYLVRTWDVASNDPDYPYTIRNYTTNIRSYKTEIQTNSSEKELVDILVNCEFTTMDEYAKKAKP